jgi:hypothetical protein
MKHCVKNNSKYNNKYSVCKLILNCPTKYPYCVYPAMSKNPKQLLNCLKMRTTSVIRIIYIYIIGPALKLVQQF